MSKIFKLNLAWKLTILICAAGLVPLYAATYYYYNQARDALLQAGKVRLEGIFHDSQVKLVGIMDGAATDLKVVSAFPLFREERVKRIKGIDWSEEERKALKGIRMRLADKLDEACVIDISGQEINRIVHDRLATPEELSPNEAASPFFGPSLNTKEGEVHIGSPYISRDTHRWVVPFTTPITDTDGRQLAILHFEINLNYLQKSLVDVPHGGKPVIYLFDEQRHMIASTSGESGGGMEPIRNLTDNATKALALPVMKVESSDMERFITRLTAGETAERPVLVNEGKISYRAVAGPLKTFGENKWFLVVSLPESDILAGLNTWNYLLFAAVATAVLGLAAFIMGRSISRPITDLYHVSMKIAMGEIDVEVPEYNRTDELGAFNASFRAMMGGIRALVQNLEQSSRELKDAKEGVERKNQEMIIKNLELLTHRQELQRRNEELTRITGAISGLILVAAERQSFDIRYDCLSPVQCWEIMEGCDPSCPVYGSKKFVCQSEGGGPCCRDKTTGAAPSIRQCMACPVYMESHQTEMSVIGENFNIMMGILQTKSEELDETKKQLIQSEKMSSIGQLAAGVAHEINNPIGFISSNMTTLSEYARDLQELISKYSAVGRKAIACECADIEEELAEIDKLWRAKDIDFVLDDLDKVVKESLDGAKRVARIVKNLKEFSHVDEAEWKLSDINEGLDSTLAIIWNELKYKAAVVKEYGDIPPVECYPMQLNQVFMNLLVNAAHAIPEKGEIRIRTWEEDGFACVAISDTGTGIPENIKDKIFNPFFTTKGVGKGTGLGLSIAYGIIEKHKGSIKVDSKVGAGTTFTIRIPVTPKMEGQAI